MTEEHCVIIGNGPAANEAAMTLRKKSPDLHITMIGREPVRHYKPHLLPDYISGKLSDTDIFVNTTDHYKNLNIKVRLGQPVVDVDFAHRSVILDHREIVKFSGLILAVGGKPRVPEPLQIFDDLMLKLKTVRDAKKWMETLDKIDSVLLVGGDLTSFSLTRALLAMGKRVYFILNEDSFWPVRFSREIYEQASRKLTDKGVEVIGSKKINRLAQLSEHSLEVETGGETIKVGAIGAFFGLVPDVKFLAGTGLDIERGVLVNEFLKTRFDGVYAAGDCAQVYHPSLRDYWVSIGYQNARSLGRTAALNLTGERREARAVPESIFNIGEITVNTSWWTEF